MYAGPPKSAGFTTLLKLEYKYTCCEAMALHM
jgi:hypothetical protein